MNTKEKVAKKTFLNKDQLIKENSLLRKLVKTYKDLLYRYEGDPNANISALLDSLTIEISSLMKYDINQKLELRKCLQIAIADFIHKN